jgi:hypothetical protein
VAFWKFIGTTAQVFPEHSITARPGEVYSFDSAGPPAAQALNVGDRLPALPVASTLWVSDPGPASANTASDELAFPSSRIINPSDVGYDIILLLGQSNMSGKGTPTDAKRDPSDSRIFQYGASGTYAGTISQAVEPLAHVETASIALGPGTAFARWYAQTVPAHRRILLVPSAKGGTPFEGASSPAGWTWKVGSNTVENLYSQAVQQAKDALAAAGANSRIVAALWVQGETDGDNSTSGATYQTDLDALIVQLRTDLSLPVLPFVIGGMVPEYLGTGTRAAINTVHAATPTRQAYTGFAAGPANANLGDGNHYNAAGQRSLARALFTAYQAALLNTNASGASASAAAPSDKTVVDLFNRADSSTTLGSADTGQAWTASPGTWGISGNAAYSVTAANDDYALVDAGRVDVKVEVTVHGVPGTNPGLVLRGTDTNNCYMANFHQSGVPTLFKRVAGTYTSLGAGSKNLANGDRLTFSAVGTTLTMLVNGTAIVTVTDSTFTTGTKVGLRIGAISSTLRYDGFSAG